MGLIAAALVVAGCGGAADSSSDSNVTTAAASSDPAAVSSIAVPPGKSTKVVIDKKEPKVSKAPIPAPERLGVKDLEVGTGPAAKNGDELTVMYVGVFSTTGRLLSSSWDWGRPSTFELGAGQESIGWERGLRGMQVGGRRQLAIPARMVSQKRNPPSNRPEEALTYTIDLFAID